MVDLREKDSGSIHRGVGRGLSPQTPWAEAQPSHSRWLPEVGYKPSGNSAVTLPNAVNRGRYKQCSAGLKPSGFHAPTSSFALLKPTQDRLLCRPI